MSDGTLEMAALLEVAHKYGRGRLRSDEQSANPMVSDEQDTRVPLFTIP